MKKIFTFMITGSVVLFFMTLISCENDQMVTTTDSVFDGSKVNGSNARVTAFATTTSYSVTPTVGTYTPNSSSNTTLPGTSGCGSFSGGVLKARVKSQSGSSFVIEIRKQDNTTFSIGGTAYVKVGSVCGSVAGQVNYSSGSSSSEITINATFIQGIVHFYPVVVSSSGGTRYFAEPLMVYTSPMYNIKSSYSTYENIGTANGVVVQAAGPNLIDNSINGILSVQCTEFCNRYYSQVYSKNIVDWGVNGNHAKFWYNRATQKGLRQIPNGTTPRVGDILCMSGGSSGFGHVAIIIEVGTGSGSSYVKVAQQNAGKAPLNASNYDTHWQHAIGGGLSYNTLTKIILPPSGYTVDGLLRL